MKKEVLRVITYALVASVITFAITFFWLNPHRQGEFSICTPSGARMTFKVANGNDITELIRRAMLDEKSGAMMINSLLSIIEGLTPGCNLGEKLCNLVEERKPPFRVKSIPIRLVYDRRVPISIAAPCENSSFLAKSIIVYPIDNNGGGEIP